MISAALPQATSCAVAANHSPTAVRFVWHHILPQACGGRTVQENLVNVCDNCHYAIHAILYDLKVNAKITKPAWRRNKRRVQYAQQGYQAAVAAGTVDKIPNEGE